MPAVLSCKPPYEERCLLGRERGRFSFLNGQPRPANRRGGQGAKTGTGGHLPGNKVVGRIAEVRGLPEGQSAISPARFPEWMGMAEAQEAVERIVAELAGDSVLAEGLGISFGLALFPVHGKTPEELIRRADQALYAAKRSDDDLHFAARAA
jgi:hypothetical protein